MESEKYETVPLTIEEVRALLEEGRKCRQEIEARLEKMHHIQCGCHNNCCPIHDKAR